MYLVEVIYVLFDEFGSDVVEGDECELCFEVLYYVNGVVEVVECIVCDSDLGDVFVFMLVEWDIWEMCELLEGWWLKNCEFVLFFGWFFNVE